MPIAPADLLWRNIIPKNRIPGESRDPLLHGSVAGKWIPAFAGDADFQVVTPSLNKLSRSQGE